MRQLGLAIVAFAAILTLQDSVNAGERQFFFFAWDDGRPSHHQHYQAQPASQYQHSQYPQPTYQYEQQQSPNVLGQLIELENRKNAWLRRTFFGAR